MRTKKPPRCRSVKTVTTWDIYEKHRCTREAGHSGKHLAGRIGVRAWDSPKKKADRPDVAGLVKGLIWDAQHPRSPVWGASVGDMLDHYKIPWRDAR